MNSPTEEIKVTLTREEIEELIATNIKEYMEMLNEVRHTIKEHPGNAYRRLAFISNEIDELNSKLVKSLCAKLELEAV